MTPQKKSASRAVAKTATLPNWLLMGGVIFVGAATLAGQAFAESHEELIVSHGISTFGSLKYPADFQHLDYVNPEAPKGGEMSTWMMGTFDTMNPYATQEGTPGALASIATERIFGATADEVGSSYCYLCTTIEYPESKDWVIFNLRDDVTFSDGVPMTADDIVFSHNLLIEQGTRSFATAVSQMITNVEALDPHRVKFTFADGIPRTGLIEQAGATPAFPKHWYEETGARLDEARFEVAPGTGAYMLDAYKINEEITYKRNPNFWGADHPLNVGQNNFDGYRVEYFADTTAAFEGFKAGAFGFRQENSSLNWATAYDFPALDKGWVKKETLSNGSLPGAYGFLFNLSNPKFDDLRVRQAIALMYNFTWTNDNLQYGLFSQRESFWQNSDMQAKGKPEGLELEYLERVKDLIDPAILTEEVTMPHASGERQLDRANLRKALALMEEAGWTAGADGMLVNDKGETFKLELLGYSPTFDRIMLPYVENLKALGIDAVWNRIDTAQYTERTNNGDFDMTYDGYRNALEEGDGLGQRYGTSGVGDVFNPARYATPASDALIEIVKAATTREEMAAGVRALDRVMRKDLFVVPAWYLANYWVAYYDMYEHPEELPPYDLGYMSFWWYNAEKGEALRQAGAFQ